MAIRIKTRQNESVGQMLRRFKKLCEKEGLTKDIKKRQYFEKPSERRRRAQRKSFARTLVRPGGAAPRGGRSGGAGEGGPGGFSAGGSGGGRRSGPGGGGRSSGGGGRSGGGPRF
ncbi:MAG TPA: 30S ribosomal protein S21 [Phycisphaerales bacterium]|nr:30S ribosomal protein S21 [Phycisphaerales bacterium]HRQ75378.1 30S ribosomal protein S21 [Phycisphaerales bacterium]